MRPSRPVNILLIEDNPGDVRLTQEAFEDTGIAPSIKVIMDGAQAIEYLEGLDKPSDLPDLIILDLNLPRKNGHQVLESIKGKDEMRRIPVLMLTTSQARQDVLKSYDRYVNCYINKPVNFDQFADVVQRIVDFWVDTVILPTTFDS